MKATENLDTLYLITLMSALSAISDLFAKAIIADQLEALRLYHEASTQLDQLSVRIGKDIKAMQTQEAADDSEMPLGTGYTNG